MEQDLNMDEKHYEDNTGDNDPLTTIMIQLQGISRLEKNLNNATAKLTTELEDMRTELNTMNEGRKADKAALIGLEKSIKELKKDVIENTNSNKNLDDKITIIDNTTNKNLERVTRLEEEIKLIKERERRRETGGKPKLLAMNADRNNDAEKVASKHDENKDGETCSDNNNRRDIFNRMMTGAEKTLDNWCNKESFAKNNNWCCYWGQFYY